MAAIHDPVPGFNDRLARPVDRFFDRVEAGRLYMRLNWSVMDDPALFQPAGHGRAGHDTAITAENAGEMLWLRIERQKIGRAHVVTTVTNAHIGCSLRLAKNRQYH